MDIFTTLDLKGIINAFDYFNTITLLLCDFRKMLSKLLLANNAFKLFV